MTPETIRQRIEDLRRLMKKYLIQAYVVPGTDAHQNEYIPGMWKRREWISGFDGSNGDAVITLGKAGLWTDSRYFIQAENQLKNTGIKLFRLGLPETQSIGEWLTCECPDNGIIGIDPSLFTREKYSDLSDRLERKNITIKCIDENLIDILWTDRPGFPAGRVYIHDISFCGESAGDKIKRLRERLRETNCRFHVITSLDSIAWLLNIRGSDIEYNPLVVAYAIVTEDRVMLFIAPGKIDQAVRISLASFVEILDYADFKTTLSGLAVTGGRAWIDQAGTGYDIISLVEPYCKIYYHESPLVFFKAIKNQTEISCMKRAMIRDGAAMVKFLSWLEQEIPKGSVTELSAEKQLLSFRQQNEFFSSLSFRTISAFAGNGAIVHYGATAETDRVIASPGLYLVDSGAQYLDGTTDITRTIALGDPTEEQKIMFTLVLKGHIALSCAQFPKGTKGIQLDTLARKFLWDIKQDYGHGTGHGVGFFLNVHEGPIAISPTRGFSVGLEPGMVCTIEPGFYKKGEYGIRIENMVLVSGNREKPDDDEQPPFYFFKIFTLCPIDLNLIKTELLTVKERVFIDTYHEKVRTELSPFLNGKDIEWLEHATMPLFPKIEKKQLVDYEPTTNGKNDKRREGPSGK